MKRVLAPSLPTTLHQKVTLSETEAHHLVRVLRLSDGEIIEAMDGRGGICLAVLHVRKGSRVDAWIESFETLAADDPRRKQFDGHTFATSPGQSALPPIHLEAAILKGDAMEWVIEKAVELGVQSVTPLMTDFTVVQVHKKGPEAFQERWQKIADQALKQCERTTQMIVHAPLALKDCVTRPPVGGKRLWCAEPRIATRLGGPGGMLPLQRACRLAPVLHVVVGPEGGFSPSEIDFLSQRAKLNEITPVTLGGLVLRAETASLFTMSVLSSYFWGQQSGAGE